MAYNYSANTVKLTVYPKRVYDTTARHPTVPTRGRWLHVLGSWPGGDGRVEDRTLPHLLRPRPASLREYVHTLSAAATGMLTPMQTAPRSAKMMMPPLVVMLRVDIGRAPSAQTHKSSESSMCSPVRTATGTQAVHVVSVDM